MNLTNLTTDLDNIQALSDKPNSVEGLSSAQLKEDFDKAGNSIKTYINDTLIVELEAGFDSKLNANASAKCNNTFDNATTSRTNLGLGSIATRNLTSGTTDPTGGSSGDIYFKYE